MAVSGRVSCKSILESWVFGGFGCRRLKPGHSMVLSVSGTPLRNGRSLTVSSSFISSVNKLYGPALFKIGRQNRITEWTCTVSVNTYSYIKGVLIILVLKD